MENTYGIDRSIPRRVMSLDEKYLRRCLESIQISASKAAAVGSGGDGEIGEEHVRCVPPPSRWRLFLP